MNKLIIKDDDAKSTSYNLIGHKIDVDNEKNRLELTLVTKNENIKYLINTDARQPNLPCIENFITKEFEKAFKNKSPFIIEEYLERSYIFIGDDDESKQFTAIKY